MSAMYDLGNLTSGQDAAMVILAFLQADCKSPEYGRELLSLGRELNLTRDINFNGPARDSLDDGDLQTDGHLPSRIPAALQDIQPSVDLLWPGNQAEAAALQQIAVELREIADQLEDNVVAQATHNLSRNIPASPSDQWQDHLRHEVDRALRRGVGLEHLPQERVVVALTLTLVKRVCQQAPWLLRSLFNTTLHYFSPTRRALPE